MQTEALHAYLRWRNANSRHRDVLVAEHKERARIRAKKASVGVADRSQQQPDQRTPT